MPVLYKTSTRAEFDLYATVNLVGKKKTPHFEG